MVAIAMPDPGIAGAVVAQTVATNTQQTASKVKDMIQKVKEWVNHKQEWVQDKIQKNAHHIQTMSRMAFMFANFMRALFQFFAVIVFFRMLIGFFSKPLEFIMLGFACIFLAVFYVIYYIFSIPPFIWVPFIIWFTIFDIIPLVVYVVVMLALFIVITLFCIVLGIINWATRGALKNLVLCQNSVAAWYKTPNFHLSNRYERGVFCSRECFPGYYPDNSGMYCIKVPNGAPSYCPQAEVMRMYTGKHNDRKYYFKDFQTNGNIKYLMKSPAEREEMLKEHYLNKRDFLEKCERSMTNYNYMPLSLCANLDTMDKNNIDAKTLNKMKKVCSQAFCNAKVNYPFCSVLAGGSDDDESDFWKRVMKVLIMVITFMFVVMFTINHMAGVTM